MRKQQVFLLKKLMLVLATIFFIGSPAWGSIMPSYSVGEIIFHDARFSSVLAQDISSLLTLGKHAYFQSPAEGFSIGELPHFTLIVPTDAGGKVGFLAKNTWNSAGDYIHALLTNKKTGQSLSVVIEKNAVGKFSVVVASGVTLTPGEYHLSVDAKESFLYTRNLTQDFEWGVVAVNTDKSIYLPREKATLSFAVLNETGGTLCNAGIQAVITDPQGKQTSLTTANGSIQKTPECGTDMYTTVPDYIASYQTNKAGVYQMHITAENHNGSHSIDDYFEVKNSVPFDVQRSKFPTRIYPAVSYPVTLTIKANEDYSGPVSDFVPQAMYIENVSAGGVATADADLSQLHYVTDPGTLVEDAKGFAKYQGNVSKLVHELITVTSKDRKGQIVENYVHPDRTNINHTPMAVVWNVNWKKGQTYTLSYTINFPPVAIDYYVLGPFTVGQNANPSFTEARQWQIASDANKCWVGTNGGTWSGNNWVAGTGTTLTTLASTDVAYFDSSTTTCTGGITTNNNSSLDASFGGSVQGVEILTYTGTITQAQSLTITTSTGYIQSASGSTFTGGSQAISDTGVFTLSAGTFTTTSGTLTVKNTYNTTGGTFNANSGTVAIDSSGSNYTITPSSETYNNFSFDDTGCNSSVTYTIAAATTLNIAGTLTLHATSCGTVTINSGSSTGAIGVQGNITASDAGDHGVRGSIIISINGTGSQSITGVATSTDGEGSIPALNINKSGGTLTINNLISIDGSGGWTWTAGTVSYGTSTVVFDNEGNSSYTITPGSTAFNNVDFNNTNCSPIVRYSIASSTTLTVAGTLTLNASSCAGVGINGPGGISAQGNITLSSSTQVVFGDISSTVVITINGTGTQTMTGVSSGSDNQGTIPSININKSSGTLNIRNVITEEDNWTWTAGTVDYTGSTVVFDSAAGNNESTTITPGSTAFNNVDFNNNNCNNVTYSIASGSTLNVSGTLTLNNSGISSCGSVLLSGPGSIAAQGDISLPLTGHTNSAGLYSPANDLTITLNGTGTQTITGVSSGVSGDGPIPNVSINKSSGTLNIRNTISVTGNWTWTAGTVDYTGSTVDFEAIETAGAASTVSPGGTNAFNNVIFDNLNCNTMTITMASSTTLTVSGSLTFQNTGSCSNNTTINGTGTIAAQGNVTSSSTSIGGTVAITLSGTAAQTISQGTNKFPTGNWTINKSSNTVSLANNMSLNSSGQTLTITAGTLDIAGHNLTVNGAFAVNGTSTFKLQGAETLTLGSSSFATGSTVNYYGTSTYATLKAGNTYGNLTFSAAGTWTMASTTTVNGNYNQSAGTVNAPSTTLTVSGTYTLSGGTFSAGSGTLNIDSTYNTTGGTFTAGTGTVAFDAAGGTYTITTGTENYNNVSFANSGSAAHLTIPSGKTMTITGSLTLSTANGFIYFAGSGTIEAKGNITNNATTYPVLDDTGATVKILIDGTSTQTLTGPSASLGSADGGMPDVTINKSSGTLNVRNYITVGQDWIWDAGTIDYTGSTLEFHAYPNAAATITPSSDTFNNVLFFGTDGQNIGNYTYTLSTGTTMTVGGTLYFNTSGGSTANSNKIIINGPGTIAALGNVTTGQTNVQGNVTVTFSGSANQTITQSGSNTFPTGNWTVNKTGGTVSLASTLTLTGTSQTLTVSAGTFDLAGNTLSLSGGSSNLTVNGTGTLALQGGETVTAHTTTIGGSSLVNYYGSGTYTSLKLGYSYVNLEFTGSGSWTAASTTTVTGTFTQSSGTFIAPSTTLTIGGSFSRSGGSFTNNSGTVAFNDNTQTSVISGSTTFNNFSVTTSDKHLTFTASSTQTVSGTLTLTGTSGHAIVLRSSSTGTQWNTVANGTISVSYVNVEDGYACGGTRINAQNSIDSTNNACWFNPTQAAFTNAPLVVATGTCNALTVQLQDGSNVAVPPSGTDVVQLSSNSSGGSFSTLPNCHSASSTINLSYNTSTTTLTVYYKDTLGSSPTWTVTGAQISGPDTLSSVTQAETIIAGSATANLQLNGGVHVVGGVHLQ